MTIIFGEGCSGKSSLALEMAKKHTHKKYQLSKSNMKAIYFSLDNDKSIEKKLEFCPNIEYKYIKSPIMLDIEYAIEEDTSFIVVDSINWINYNNFPDKGKSELTFTLKDIIRSFEYIESVYKVEVVAVFNTLKMVDSTSKSIIDACKGVKAKIRATSKRSVSKKSKRDMSSRG